MRLAGPTSRTVGTAAASATQQFTWLWSRESILRLALSFVLATALWLYLSAKQNPKYIDFNRPIPVSTSNLGTGLTVTNQLPHIHLRYRADNPNAYVTPANFHAFVNILNLKPGVYARRPVTVLTDPGLHVSHVRPQFVPVTLERTTSKAIPVLPNYLRANPAVGYQALSPTFSPNTVKVSGPQSVVDQITHATIDINLSGLHSSIDFVQRPSLRTSQDESITGAARLTTSPAQIEVQVPIRALASFKTLPLVARIYGHAKSGFGVSGVTVSPPQITVHGPPSVLKTQNQLQTQPVWLRKHGAGQLTERVRILGPRRVSIDANSRYATVTVQLQPIRTTSTQPVRISLLNLGPGMNASVKPGRSVVTLVGPATGPKKATTATINLTGYGVGTYVLSPVITPPRGFSVVQLLPSSVTVQVTPANG